MNYEELTGFVDSRFASGHNHVRLDDVFAHFMEHQGRPFDEVEDAFVLGLMLDRFDYREEDDALVPHDAIRYGDAIQVLTEAAKTGQKRVEGGVSGSELEDRGPRKPRGPPRRKAGAHATAPDAPLPLESLRGIGRVRAEALKEAGYESLATLASADAGRVAEELHVSVAEAEAWIARARARVGGV